MHQGVSERLFDFDPWLLLCHSDDQNHPLLAFAKAVTAGRVVLAKAQEIQMLDCFGQRNLPATRFLARS